MFKPVSVLSLFNKQHSLSLSSNNSINFSDRKLITNIPFNQKGRWSTKLLKIEIMIVLTTYLFNQRESLEFIISPFHELIA